MQFLRSSGQKLEDQEGVSLARKLSMMKWDTTSLKLVSSSDQPIFSQSKYERFKQKGAISIPYLLRNS